MDVITDIMIRRLIAKGMETTTIPAYFRDVANTIAGNSGLSLRGINRQVKLLGWDEIDLDDHTLQLMIAVFEGNGLPVIEDAMNPVIESPCNQDNSSELRG